MEASKLSCIGSPRHALYAPSRGVRIGGSQSIKAAQVVKSSCSTPLPLIPSRRSSSHSQQLRLVPVVGALSNLVPGLPVWAAEEASSSVGGSTQVSEAGAVVEGAGIAVQSSVEGAGVAASQAVQSSAESVGDAASQVVQSSVESVRRTASLTAGADASTSGTSIGNGDMVINILGTTAFIGLSLLTLAVLYLFITDFLEKRKRDEELKKLNEEEAALRRKKGSSLTAANKGGVSKGFGRKRPLDDDVSASQ